MKAQLDKVPTDRPYRLIVVGTRDELNMLKAMMQNPMDENESSLEQLVRETIFNTINGGIP